MGHWPPAPGAGLAVCCRDHSVWVKNPQLCSWDRNCKLKHSLSVNAAPAVPFPGLARSTQMLGLYMSAALPVLGDWCHRHDMRGVLFVLVLLLLPQPRGSKGCLRKRRTRRALGSCTSLQHCSFCMSTALGCAKSPCPPAWSSQQRLWVLLAMAFMGDSRLESWDALTRQDAL